MIMPEEVKRIIEEIVRDGIGYDEVYDMINYEQFDRDDLPDIMEQVEAEICRLWGEKEQLKKENAILKQLLNNAEKREALYQQLRAVTSVE